MRANDQPSNHGSSGAGSHANHRDGDAGQEGTAILARWSGLVDGLVESFRSRRSEPGLREVMSSAVNIMQDRITRSRLAIDPPELVLRPQLPDFQLMDFHRAREAIEAGRNCVEEAGPQFDAIDLPRRGPE